MEIQLYQVDAFTRNIFSGNPAGVVTNADNLDDRTMQKIAREMNLSETAFIINKKTDEYDIEVRFFTPVNEVPICGHATISAHYVYAQEHNIKKGIIRQKTKAGILPVEIQQDGNDLKIVMTQAQVVFGDIIENEKRLKLLEGLGIKDVDLCENLPVQIVSTGHSKVMIPIKSKRILDNIKIRETILSDLSDEINCNGYFVFTFDSQENGVLTSGRMFAPAIGISEDPVTGNANGPLGAYLVKYNRIEIDEDRCMFTIKQGEAIGRKGYMDVNVFCNDGYPELVKIVGNAKIVFKTTVQL